MILQSVAVLALASTAAMPNLGSFLHLHPHTEADTRVSVTLLNQGTSFRDVTIAGQTYTIHSHANLTIKAPAGTPVFTASYMPRHHKGDMLVAITPTLNNTTITLN